MSEIAFPYKPALREEDGYLTVQKNLETLARLFMYGQVEGDVPIWNEARKRYVPGPSAGWGLGLQYHEGTYGPHNVGDWLDVATTGTQENDEIPNFSNAAQLFRVGGSNFGIVFWATQNDPGPMWSFSYVGLLYYLDGEWDLGYTQGGDFIRYTGGGSVLFYTTDGGLPNCGDFAVYTSGSSDDSGGVGDIQLDASNVDGPAGDITFVASGDTPGKIHLSTISPGAFMTSPVGSIIAHLATGASLLVQQAWPGDSLFEVREDGTVHIKTGGTIVADL